jgi:hypothetical protein
MGLWGWFSRFIFLYGFTYFLSIYVDALGKEKVGGDEMKAKWLTRVVIGRKLQSFGLRGCWGNFQTLCD